MKKLLIVISALLAMVGASYAQVSAQSTQLTFDGGAVSFQYINDGLTGAAAIKFNDLGLNDVGGVKGLRLSGLLVNPAINTEQNSYIGALLNYTVFANDRVNVNAGVGLKGLDVSSLFQGGGVEGFNFNGSRQMIWSIGISVKL